VIPLRTGTPAEFNALRRFLESSGYTEDALCSKLRIDDLSKIEASENSADAQPLAKLFLFGEDVPIASIDPEGVRLLERFGLIEKTSRFLRPAVALYPYGSLYLVSDRTRDAHEEAQPDFVFSAITPNTQSFMQALPETQCDRFLDLGTGAGIAALRASHYAKHVWATDITPRSVAFAEFNRNLNAVENVTVLCGDMYEPVAGLQFDRIAAHLPYFPSLDKLGIYVDGGEDGETITRRTVEGLPHHLAPGGRYLALTMCSDRKNESVEDRIRRWLGPTESEFDVLLIVRTLTDPDRFAAEAVANAGGSYERQQAYRRRFENLNVEQFVYGYIVIQRKAEHRPEFTLRRTMTTACSAADIERLMDWESRAHNFDWNESRPKLLPHTELHVTHTVQNGELTPVNYTLRCTSPFDIEIETGNWMAMLVSGCNGQRSGRELFEIMERKFGMRPEQFAVALKALISAGMISAGMIAVEDQLASGNKMTSSS
jgi:SAM-dependent methyltransferase